MRVNKEEIIQDLGQKRIVSFILSPIELESRSQGEVMKSFKWQSVQITEITGTVF